MKSLITLNNLMLQKRLFFFYSAESSMSFKFASLFGFAALGFSISRATPFINYLFYSSTLVSKTVFFNKLSNKIFIKKGILKLLVCGNQSTLFLLGRSSNSLVFKTATSAPAALNFDMCRLAALLY
jgi:hypothetical protein